MGALNTITPFAYPEDFKVQLQRVLQNGVAWNAGIGIINAVAWHLESLDDGTVP
jgi:hypothetical protein